MLAVAAPPQQPPAPALPLRLGGTISASGLKGKFSKRVVSGVIRNSKEI